MTIVYLGIVSYRELDLSFEALSSAMIWTLVMLARGKAPVALQAWSAWSLLQ